MNFWKRFINRYLSTYCEMTQLHVTPGLSSAGLQLRLPVIEESVGDWITSGVSAAGFNVGAKEDMKGNLILRLKCLTCYDHYLCASEIHQSMDSMDVCF